MAHGDNIVRTEQMEAWTLIDAAVATADGVWIDSGDFPEGNLEVTIVTTATVQIRGSDAATKPANTAHGHQIGSDITATAGYSVNHLPRWLKARVSAWTAGAVTVTTTLRRRTA